MQSLDRSRVPVSHEYWLAHQDAINCAADIAAICIIRDPDTGPAEPLYIAIDQSTLDHMGWRQGDAITLVSVLPEAGHSEGKLIIRKAEPGELALILKGPLFFSLSDREGIDPTEVHGASFEWGFPFPWVEMFFPGRYDDESPDFNSTTTRWWRLTDVLGQAGQIELTLDPDELFLYLQRTSPAPMSLDLHIAPGLLALKDWLQRTPLVLESATDFDPFTTEDVLTIRECSLGEEPNLRPARAGYVADVNPLWLSRFFPDHHNVSERPDYGDVTTGLDAYIREVAAYYDAGMPDVDRLDDDEPAPKFDRHTLVATYSMMKFTDYSLCFEIKSGG